MLVPCIYRYHQFDGSTMVYVCEFKKQVIQEDDQIIPNGPYRPGYYRFHDNYIKTDKSKADVVGVIFNECILTKVPRGLTKIFPNMQNLNILSSNLKNVNKMDLAEYKSMTSLNFSNNKIKYLPGDLLEGFKNLEIIGFPRNELKLVHPDILDGLDKLKHVNFRMNSGYTKCFSKIFAVWANATLEEVKDELIARYNKDDLKDEDEDQSEIQNFLKTDETFKDFTIAIAEHEFRVHKVVLASRSPTLAEVLTNNADVERLNLVGIPVEIFKKILHFFYTDELPTDEGTNFLDLFAAAGKLKVEEVMEYAVDKLINKIGEMNAFDVLKLSNKYKHDELRQAAFNKIKNDHPKIDFKDEWANDVEKLIKMIKAYGVKFIKKY